METVVTVVQVSLGVGAALALIRAVRGPTLADRIIAVDLILLLLAGGLTAETARAGSLVFAPVLVAVSLVAFAGTVVVGRFIEWRDTE